MSDVTLKEFFEMQLVAMKQAVDKAEATLNKRLEGMNEFRDTLKDQASRLATKEELNSLYHRIEQLEKANAEAAGRAKVSAILWAMVVSVGIGVVLRLLKL